jgi:hypothetical protein
VLTRYPQHEEYQPDRQPNSLAERMFATNKYPHFPFVEAISLLCLLCCVSANAADITLCKVEDVQTSMPSSEINSLILRNDFASYSRGDSDGEILFRNVFAKKIKTVSLVVQYTNNQGDVLAQMQFAATDGDDTRWDDTGGIPEHVSKLSKAIRVGETAHIISLTHTVMLECPTKAHAVSVYIKFFDRKEERWAEQDATILPSPKTIPRTMDFSFDSDDANRPPSILIRGKISPEGRITSLESLDGQHLDLLKTLELRMKEWAFYPAQQESKPIEGSMNFVVSFYRPESSCETKGECVEAEGPRVPFVPVSFFPDPVVKGRWSVLLGVLLL